MQGRDPFFKTQQWQVTNYTLLAYAALVATPPLIKVADWKSPASGICAILVAIAAVLACMVLVSQELALEKERDRLKAARCKLPLVKKIHNQFKPRWRRVVLGGLLLAVMGGAALAISINLSRIPWVAACLTAGP
jgi:hypothetical protein